MAKSQIDSVANCPMNGVLLSGRIEKVFCVLVACLWFAGAFLRTRALGQIIMVSSGPFPQGGGLLVT